MAPLRTAIAMSILTMLATSGVGRAGSNHPDPSTVRAALEHQNRTRKSSATVQAQATSPLAQFNLRGLGTEVPNSITGTCSGEPCAASAGDCECITYSGTLTATNVGNASWNAAITVNLDDCVNTGTEDPSGGGFCCFGDGTLDAMTGSGNSASTLAMSFTGPICNDPNANDDTSIQMGFIIDTADSTGKFQHSAGTGQINLFEADDATTYVVGNGLIQPVSPF